MKIWIFFFAILKIQTLFALELEYLNQAVLPHKLKYKKSTVGGISGLYRDPDSGNLFAVSDDRGNINEPRIYEFKITVTLKDFKVEPVGLTLLTVNQSQKSHQSTKSKAKLFSKVLDLEGISKTPWGDFLLINEGDMNRKPRVQPQLFAVQADGNIAREFEIPADFLPETTGEQKKGVQNNLALEGLAASPNLNEWLVSAEGPLMQDSKGWVRWIQYHMPEAWILKKQKEYLYPQESIPGSSDALIEFQRGVSEIHYLDSHRILVLERLAQISSKGLGFQIQVAVTDLKMAKVDGKLTKQKVLDLKDLALKIGKLENFEGMTLGPLLSDGRKSLILVSDDNFMRDQRTQFLLFAIKE